MTAKTSNNGTAKTSNNGKKDHDMSEYALDGGYGWVIVFASFIINVIVDGVCFSFGVFYIEFLDYYGESKSKTSWVGSVLNGMYLSMGPIVSALATKYGCRNVAIAGSILASCSFIASTFSPNVSTLIFLYGGLGGMGFGLMYLPAIVVVGFYFKKRRALASGMAVCGSGIGAFVLAPVSLVLITYFGWKGATWIISAIVLNGVVMAFLFRPLESNIDEPKKCIDKGQKEKLLNRSDNCKANGKFDDTQLSKTPDEKLYMQQNSNKVKEENNKKSQFELIELMKDMIDFSLLKNPVFLIYGISCFLCMIGFFVPFIYLPDHAIKNGISPSNAAFLLSIIGIANTIARVLCGLISDMAWTNCLQINNYALIIGGIATMVLPLWNTYILLAIYSCIFGASIAVFVSLRPILMIELIGLESLIKTFGLVTFFQGLSSFIGAPIAGILFDITGNYTVSFYVAGACLSMAGVICIPLKYIAKRRDKKLYDLINVTNAENKV